MPASFAVTPDGTLLVADGFDPMLRWDGFSAAAEPAGVAPPSAACVVSGNGKGPIVGAYRAFVRFVSESGSLSNLSPVSAEYQAVGGSGAIANATNTTPIVVASAGHGLTSGSVVKIGGVLGNSAANGTWTTTVLTPNSFSLNASAGNANYASGGTFTAGVATIVYSSVPTTSSPRVRRRQILRNTDGQEQTFYVDVDTADLGSTTFSSTKIDSILQVQQSQALLDQSGRDLSLLYGVPPDHRAVIAHHLGRMFAAAEVEYAEGAVSVTFGSPTVTGVGTEWTAVAAGRFLYVSGGDQSYQVAAVNVAAQTLTLAASYTSSTDAYAGYSLRPPPAYRQAIFYSEAGLPEAWPVYNAFTLEEDGDDVTGLLVYRSFIYILKRRHVYKFTFAVDPATDGDVFLSTNRGCVNNRCAVVVENVAYMMDEEGVWAFRGTNDADNVSTPIQTIFRRPASGSPNPHINWSASRYFHAVADPATETIRWFVALSGQYLPRHALVYAYKLDRWWLEEYAEPVGSSCLGKLARSSTLSTWGYGRDQVFLGGSSRRILARGASPLDGVDAGAGPVRGAVVSATWSTVTLDHVPPACVGASLVLTDGRGIGQRRRITSVQNLTNGTAQLQLLTPWAIRPDATSAWLVGGVQWSWRSGWFTFADSEDLSGRRVALVFQPTGGPERMTLRQYRDHADIALVNAITRADDGVRLTKGSADAVVSMDRGTGTTAVRLNEAKELYTQGRQLISVGLSGVAGPEPAEVYQITLDGVEDK